MSMLLITLAPEKECEDNALGCVCLSGCVTQKSISLMDMVFDTRSIIPVARSFSNTPVTPGARCHYGFWSKPPSP